MSRQFSNADVACRECGRMCRWVTSARNNMRFLVESDCSDDGIYALDYKPGETVARWVHEPYRERLRQSQGLYVEHACSKFSRRSA